MGIRNLVLGGSGLIGSELGKQLEKQGQYVRNLDLKVGLDILQTDLNEYRDYDYVWFLAWDVGGAKYLNDPDNFTNILNYNTQICLRVFDFLERTMIPFTFTSSQLAGMDNPYGITKKLGEEWAKVLGGQTIRLWNVYGWEPPGKRSHVVPDLVRQALETSQIRLITDGTEERQFIHVQDCASNMIRMRGKDIRNVDLSSGEWVSILELAGIIGDITGASVRAGKERGYTNRIDPEFSNHLQITLSLKQGLCLILKEHKDHALSTKST